MNIVIEHFDGKYPSFNVGLASAEGKEPFLVIKGCRLVDGKDGRFVSWPAKKQDNGKYWNHAWASDKFAAAVLQAYDDSKPGKPKKSDDDSDIPF
jgi:DNA-binding cell septation regulator SpoVG